MNIVEFLQKGQYMRLTCEDKWMFWSFSGWNVVQRKKHARVTTTLLVTKDEELAIAELKKGNEDFFDKV